MSCSLRYSLAVGLFALVSLAGLNASAQSPSPAQIASQIRTATFVALKAPQSYTLPLGAHRLTVNPAKVTSTLTGTTITGKITRKRGFLPDQHLAYTIKKFNGKVVSVEFNPSGLGSLAYTPKFSGAYVGKRVFAFDIEPLILRLAYSVGDKWETMAELLVVSIALKAPDKSGLKLPDPNTLQELQFAKPTVKSRK